MSARRIWLIAWPAGPLIGIANGTLREVAYKDRVGELTAHQLSTGSAIALFAGYFEWLAGRWPLSSTREALEVGAAWLGLRVRLRSRCRPHLVGRAPGRLRPPEGPSVAAGARVDPARTGRGPRAPRTCGKRGPCVERRSALGEGPDAARLTCD